MSKSPDDADRPWIRDLALQLPMYERALAESRDEEDIHQFLASHRDIALHAFDDGSVGLDIASKFRLGSEFVADFVLLGCRSYGYPLHCVFVELESPRNRAFTKSGLPSAKLNQAIRQITDWQHWLREHSDEFNMSLPRSLKQWHSDTIERDLRSAMMSFKIVIGRRGDMTRKNDEFRSSFYQLHDGRVEIMSYDRITFLIRHEIGLPLRPEDITSTLWRPMS